VVCLLALGLVLMFLLKRKIGRKWDDGYEMDDEREKSPGHGSHDDTVDIQEYEVMGVSDACDWLTGFRRE
jgi:hypothetical protein